MACDKVIDKARKIAAHQLEANADDLEYVGGAFRGEGLARQDDAAGGDRVRGVHRAQPARRPGAEPRGPGHLRPAELLVAVRHAHLRGRGRHRDRPRRRARVRRRRRLRRAGQPADRRRPGARRRRSRASPRRCSRRPCTTPTATCKTSTLAEYLVPAASDVPSITLGHTVTPSPTNPLGVKGIGEAGTIGAAPAVINAICRRAVRPRRHRRADAGQPAQRLERNASAAANGGSNADDPRRSSTTSGPARPRRRSASSASTATTPSSSPAGTACCR